MSAFVTGLRTVLARYQNEEGQELLITLLLIFIIWLLISGGRIIIQ